MVSYLSSSPASDNESYMLLNLPAFELNLRSASNKQTFINIMVQDFSKMFQVVPAQSLRRFLAYGITKSVRMTCSFTLNELDNFSLLFYLLDYYLYLPSPHFMFNYVLL